LLQLDSIGNPDGTGILFVNKSTTSIYRTKDAASSIDNLGMEIRENITTSKYPVMAHVRYASKGIDVTDDNVHPFEGTRFFLAHNGRLYKKDTVVTYSGIDDTNISSDSLLFLSSLENVAKSNPNGDIVTLLNSAMSQYKGKFAFLIYDKHYDKHYVVRGFSAELHLANISEKTKDSVKPIGFIVNTKKNSLENVIAISSQIAQAVSGRYIVSDDIIELDKETVYEVVGDNLVKVGELKENSVTYTTHVTHVITHTKPVSSINDSLEIWKYSERINKFMNDHYLSIADIDALFTIFLGIGMANAQPTDLDIFINIVIPVISAGKKTKHRLSQVMDKYSCIYPSIYHKVKDLQYPWMVNDAKTIEAMIKFVGKKNKALKG
jgi:predicted glutamine amidotransferase